MKDYTIKGNIMIHPVSRHAYAEGLSGLIIIQNKLNIVKLTHCNVDSDWVVDGDCQTTLSREKVLFTLKASVAAGLIPIATKDWPYIISEDLVNKRGILFNVKPFKFKPGIHVQTCSECYSIFDGAATQPYCKDCCSTKYAVATLTAKEKEKIRTFDEEFVRHVAHESWLSGCKLMNQMDFQDWLNKTLNNGSNIITRKPKG